MSDISLYSIVSSVLALYNIKAPLDEFGKPKQLKADYTSRFLSYVLLLFSRKNSESNNKNFLFTCRYPVPFECIIEPRSKAAESLIHGLSD